MVGFEEWQEELKRLDEALFNATDHNELFEIYKEGYKPQDYIDLQSSYGD